MVNVFLWELVAPFQGTVFPASHMLGCCWSRVGVTDRWSPCLPISGSASSKHVHTYAPAHSHAHTCEHMCICACTHTCAGAHTSCSCATRPCSPSPSKAVTLQVSTSPPGRCVCVRTDQLRLWAWRLPRLLGNTRQVPGPLQGSA